MKPRGPQAGFSLIEILVAFAILAVSLGVLLQIFSRGTSTTIATAQYSRAIALAEARLAAVGSAIPLKEGSTSGEPEDGFAWEVVVAAVELGDTAAEPGLSSSEPMAKAYRTTVSVLWPDGRRARRLTLSTLRLSGPGD